MFNIEFNNDKGGKDLVWQTSWGFTTRSLGIMVLIHGDDNGLVMPPRVSKFQVVVVPIVFQSSDNEKVMNKAKEVVSILNKSGIRVHLDDRLNYTPGWKFNHWEVKGVPLRIEIGLKDIEKEEVKLVRRFDGVI